MRTIDRASSFKRDYKREAKGQHRATLDSELKPVLVALVTDQPLAAKYRDSQGQVSHFPVLRNYVATNSIASHALSY